MLPLYALSDCPHCGYSLQGTRARGGSVTPCRHCRRNRKVPINRPQTGPDDPFARPPRSGRPFEKGNPYRFTSQQEPY